MVLDSYGWIPYSEISMGGSAIQFKIRKNMLIEGFK
jgi:hypothetical protein